MDNSPTENVVIVLIGMIADKDGDEVEDDHHDVHPTLAMSSPLQRQRRLNLVDFLQKGSHFFTNEYAGKPWRQKPN